MIRFREEQMPQFEMGVEDAFVWEQVRRLRKDFPDDLARNGMKDAELEGVIRAEMKKADEYGFDSRDLVTFYLDCVAILGPRFDANPQHPWAGAILRRADLIPESKADLLDQHLIFEHGS
ncbi:MAG: hypothetical protein U0791_07435 [Gemmataceae bacterium]